MTFTRSGAVALALLVATVACQPVKVEDNKGGWPHPDTLEYAESYADIKVPDTAQDVRWSLPHDRTSTLSLYFVLSRTEAESFISSTHATKTGQPRVVPVGQEFLDLGVPDRTPVPMTFYSRENGHKPEPLRAIQICTTTSDGEQIRLYVST